MMAGAFLYGYGYPMAAPVQQPQPQPQPADTPVYVGSPMAGAPSYPFSYPAAAGEAVSPKPAGSSLEHAYPSQPQGVYVQQAPPPDMVCGCGLQLTM